MVFENGGPVLGDRDDELGGEGRGFGVLVGGREHVPIAADGLIYLHGDGRVFVIAQRNFKFHFPNVGVNALVVRLLVLGDDIESVANVNVDVFVFRGVVDAVFAGEENAALRVLLIDTDVACRERNAQAVLFFISEFVIDHHGIFQVRAGILLVAVVVALAVDNEDL